MLKRVGSRLWFRLIWAVVMLVVIPTTSWTGDRRWVTIVWEIFIAIFLIATVWEIRSRSRAPIDLEPAPVAPARTWRQQTEWVSPQTVGLLAVVFITVLLVARAAYR